MLWRGRRWRVIDQPTRLGPRLWYLHPAITHPPEGDFTGWRFTARSEDGEAVGVDVIELGGVWRVMRCWE